MACRPIQNRLGSKKTLRPEPRNFEEKEASNTDEAIEIERAKQG